MFSTLIASLTFMYFVIYSNAVDLRKCCPTNQILQLDKSSPLLTTYSQNYHCVFSHNSSNNSNLKHLLFRDPVKESVILLDFQTRDNICEGSWSILDNRVDKWFEIRKDGVYVGLNFWFWPAWLSVDSNSYCVDNAEFPHENDSLKFEEDNDVTEALIFCRDPHNFKAYITHRSFYGVLYMISSIFVFLTLVIYVVLWEEQNTHGCAQISFFVAIFLFYLLEGARIIVKLNGFYIVPSTACFVHAVFCQYFFVCINTTSGVLGFDLLWIFWHLDPKAYMVKNWKRIHIYNIISWVLPFLGIAFGLVLHHFISPEEAKRNEVGLFEFAHYRCSSPLWHFTFYIQAILFIVNIVFFGITSTLIYKHRNTSASAIASRRTQKHLSESISIFSKLFFVLGMTWIVIIIEFFLGEKDPLSYYWLILRILNLLLGVVYFILFGTNRKNLTSLRQKYEIIDRLMVWIGLKQFKNNQTVTSSKRTMSTDSNTQLQLKDLKNSSDC